MNTQVYDAYLDYMAIRSHFTSASYDYFKYSGKVNTTPAAFERRKDKHLFAKLSRFKDRKNLILANAADGASLWLGDILGEQGKTIYNEWRKRQEALTYTFKQDIAKLKSNFNENFKVPEHSHPYILSLYLVNDICIESITILLDLTKATANWDKHMPDDLMWADVSKLTKKYTPFLSYDKKKFKRLLLEHFSSKKVLDTNA